MSNKSPFKFLDSYAKEDKEIFFGRDMETAELYDRLFETNLVLLYGASGTGKTSLINCGLANLFEPADWLPIFVRRKEHILESMRDELNAHAVKKCPPTAGLVECVRSLYLDYFKPIYLIFDQFEELFILGDKQEQTEFFTLLQNLLQAGLQCKVILSMREEYIAVLSEFEPMVPSLFANRLRIEKMSLRTIKEVIVKTVQKLGIELNNDQSTADLIVERLRGKGTEIDLANMQVYLDRLYRLESDRKLAENRPQTRFDSELVEHAGDLEDVMSLYLDEQLETLESELRNIKGVQQSGIPMDILFALVTDTGTKQAVDISAVKAQLQQSKQIPPAIVDYCVERFQEMRIVRRLSN